MVCFSGIAVWLQNSQTVQHLCKCTTGVKLWRMSLKKSITTSRSFQLTVGVLAAEYLRLVRSYLPGTFARALSGRTARRAPSPDRGPREV